jgi:hypothetical protein
MSDNFDTEVYDDEWSAQWKARCENGVIELKWNEIEKYHNNPELLAWDVGSFFLRATSPLIRANEFLNGSVLTDKSIIIINRRIKSLDKKIDIIVEHLNYGWEDDTTFFTEKKTEKGKQVLRGFPLERIRHAENPAHEVENCLKRARQLIHESSKIIEGHTLTGRNAIIVLRHIEELYGMIEKIAANFNGIGEYR